MKRDWSKYNKELIKRGEILISVFKRWFGEHVVSRRFENMRKEIMFKVGIINMFLMAGKV